MKNFLLLFVLPLMLLNCSNDENDLELSSSEENDLIVLTELVNKANKSSSTKAGDSAENPIVVSSNTFVDHVNYTIPICGIDNNQFALESFGGLFYGLPTTSGVSSAPTIYALTSTGCYERILNSDAVNLSRFEFKFGLYYEIFGVVVRLSDPRDRTRGFWFADIENSNQVRRVTFNQDGSSTFSDPRDFPYQTGLNCSNAISFPTGSYVTTQFPSGQRAVREIDGQNFLYVSTGLGFVFSGTCSDGDNAPVVVNDICLGVAPFNASTRYKNGDQVVFDGYLFTKVRRSWRREGKCGTD